MDQKLKDIIESGLLELYVIGALNDQELRQVETWLNKYPQLQSEIQDIEKALGAYGKANAVTPPENLKQVIKSKLSKATDHSVHSNEQPQGSNNNLWKLIMTLGLISIVGFSLYYINRLQNKVRVIETTLIACENELKEKDVDYVLLEDLKHQSNQIVLAEATEKYPETEIYIHNNSVTQKTFLQFQSLPTLTDDQSFQLWSLKEDSDPIPLNVFDKLDGEIIEVAFIENTMAYAITIEPKGGSQSPNLADLIGVFNIRS